MVAIKSSIRPQNTVILFHIRQCYFCANLLWWHRHTYIYIQSSRMLYLPSVSWCLKSNPSCTKPRLTWENWANILVADVPSVPVPSGDMPSNVQHTAALAFPTKWCLPLMLFHLGGFKCKLIVFRKLQRRKVSNITIMINLFTFHAPNELRNVLITKWSATTWKR